MYPSVCVLRVDLVEEVRGVQSFRYSTCRITHPCIVYPTCCAACRQQSTTLDDEHIDDLCRPEKRVSEDRIRTEKGGPYHDRIFIWFLATLSPVVLHIRRSQYDYRECSKD